MHPIKQACRWLISASLACGFVLTASTVWAGEPTDFIKRQAERVDDVMAENEASEARAEAFAEIIDEVVDFRELASRALGTHWKEQSEDNREQFLDLLEKLLRANYKSKITGEKLGEDYNIEYLEEKKREDRAFVATRVVWGDADNERKPLDFKLMKKKKGWVVYDMVIDDISLEATYRDSYTEIIEEEGWDALIEKMKKRIEQLRAKAQKETDGASEPTSESEEKDSAGETSETNGEETAEATETDGT
jgi:phospholipid transport system substrate-binding protein